MAYPELKNAPLPLSIDIDQWRRDIRTFGETTDGALKAIIEQLSQSCTNGSPVAQGEIWENHPSQTQPDPLESVGLAGNVDRLNELKNRISQRLS